MAEWEKLLKESIEALYSTEDPNEQFYWVIAKSMVGCFIGLFMKKRLLTERFKELKTTKIKTGLGGSTGNKGAVILRFKLDDTTIALVNCHLQSGNNKGSLRTDEINNIFDNAFKNEPDGKKYQLYQHDMIYLFGDLNYRITLPNDTVRAACKRRDWEYLKQHDEMIQAQFKHGQF